MQDNNSSNQQLIDLGWQRMSTLLDKELPRTTRRRRFGAWWFIAAGIFLGLAALGYTALQNAQPDVLREVPATQTPVEIAPQSMPSKDEMAIQEKESEQTLDEPSHQFKSPVGIETAATGRHSTKGKGFVKEVATTLAPAAQNAVQENLMASDVNAVEKSATSELPDVQFTVASKEIAVTEVNHNDNTEEPVAFQNTDQTMTRGSVAAEPVSMPSATRSIISVAQLSERSPGTIGDRWNAVMIPVADPKRDGRFALDVMVATHLNADADPFYGIEAGLSTPLFSGKRLSVHAGVSYGHYNIDGVGLGIFNSGNAQDDEFADPLNNGGGPDTNGYSFPIYAVEDVLTGDLEYSEAQALTEKFHYIHLPLRVECRILPRLLVMAGVKASVLLAAPARYRLNDGRFAAPQSTSVSGSKSFLYNYDIIRKVDVAPLVGLSYDIGERLSIDATYSHGLRHYINNDDAGDRSDYHRSASVGVRYRIL